MKASFSNLGAYDGRANGSLSIDLILTGSLVRMTGAGTIDLGSKMLAFRVEPKLVMTTQGQGGRAVPIGLGIPVVVKGHGVSRASILM